jgi:hypothetical protein
MCLILNGYGDRAARIWYLNPLHFCLRGWMNSEVYKWKLDTHHELLLRILSAVSPALRNLKINSDEQHAIFAQELQSALRLTFSSSFCVQQQSCHMNIILKTKIKQTVNNFSFFSINIDFVFLNSNCCISVLFCLSKFKLQYLCTFLSF